MLQTIPTRISGAAIVRQTAVRRVDGSAMLVRRRSPRPAAGGLSHEQVITADFAFTCEPSFSRANVERSLRCLEGEVYTCLVDVRLGSPTFGHWQSFCLSEGDSRTLSVPAGVACGWQVLSCAATLEINATCEIDDTRWQWLRWNDQELDLRWPELPSQLACHVRPSRTLSRIAQDRLPQWRDSSECVRRGRSTGQGSGSSKQLRSPIVDAKSATSAASPARSTRSTRTQAVRRSGELGPSQAARKPYKNAHEIKVAKSLPRLATQTSDNAREPRRASAGAGPAAGPATAAVRSAATVDSTKQRILVIGSSGQLGRDLCRHLRSLGTVIGACRTPDKQSLLPVPMWVDISRPASVRQAIRQVRPTLIVNAASLTDVDQAEQHPRLAQLVNATGPAVIADEAQRVGACVVHFCSSMVFSGRGDKPWRESDQPDPQNQYARTKWIGTQALSCSQVPHLILRTGWLYSTHGENYVRRLIDSLSYRSTVTLADDHVGSPTSTNFLAQLTADLLLRAGRAAERTQQSLAEWLHEHGGLYHASTLGMASKLQVGDQILALCRQHGLPIVLQKLQGRHLSELPSSAHMPANCALDPSRLALHFQVDLPRWQTDLAQQIDYMLGAHSLTLGSVA